MTPAGFGSAILDLLYPPQCLACGELDEPFCDGCRAEVAPVPPGPPPRGLIAVRHAGCHDGPLRKAVLRLKLHRQVALVSPLSGLLAAELTTVMPIWRPDLIVPVPVHWTRRLGRGFNQAELLAEALSRRLKVPVAPVVRKVRWTPDQVGKSATERAINLQRAFEVVRNAPVSGRRILLVDDVMTTGSTLAACAEALRRGGAAAVYGATVTRRTSAGP